MKKLFILLAAAAAVQLTACSDDDDRIFDRSAAERLEQGRKDFTEALCADGGTWELQYFSNYDEPGYIFVCQFEPDGSVTIHTDHQWIGNEYKSEKSLWQIISDNGNVLTFNSYNTLFHVFSTPENIVGPGAPTNPTSGADINEQGYGHNGDYEFLLMENEGDRIRIIGKKRGLTGWLTKLPADTDIEAYLGDIKALRTGFSSKFPTLCLTEVATGATFDVSKLASGVPSIVPFKSTSPNSRTVSGNGIFTTTGFRFMRPIEVIREDNTLWELSEFTWAEDGSLVSGAGRVEARITAQAPGVNLADVTKKWALDKETMSPALTAKHDAASAAVQASAGSKFDLRAISFGYFANAGKTYFSVTIYAGTRLCRDFYEMEVNDDYTEVKLTLVDANKASADFDKVVPEYTAFKQALSGTFAIENIAPMNASTIVFTSVDDPEVSFQVNVQ